jgi:hypothetical protein
MPDSVAGVLERAADRLSKPGAWTKGHLALDAQGKPVNPTYPEAVRWCLAGGLQSVAGGAGTELFCSAYARLSRTIGSGVAAWNDTASRTQAEVVAALRTAAQQARP